MPLEPVQILRVGARRSLLLWTLCAIVLLCYSRAVAFQVRTVTFRQLSTTASSHRNVRLGSAVVEEVDAVPVVDPNDQSYSASDWLHNIQSLPRSTILREIRGPVLAVVAWSTVISLVHKLLLFTGQTGIAAHMSLSSKPHSLLVSSLGLLLVFRTNTAYQRFAEGRRIWEKILSTSRNISRMTYLYNVELGSDRIQRVLRLLVAFPYLLKQHIQPQCMNAEEREKLQNNALLLQENSRETVVQRNGRWHISSSRRRAGLYNRRQCCVDGRSLPWCLLPPAALLKCAESANRPLWVCDRLSEEMNNVQYTDNFTSRERLTFFSHIDKLSQYVGECERIHQTAVPLNYARHSLRSLTIWLFTLPFAMVGELGLLTGPVMGAIAWLMMGVYQIGYTIEDPFQGSLRLRVLCDAIYRDVMSSNTGLLYRQTAFVIDDKELEEWKDMAAAPLEPELRSKAWE